MTDIVIDGKIIKVVTRKDFDFASYQCQRNQPNPRTIIEPTGAIVSVIELSIVDGEGPPVGFILSDDFNIGDIVELYSNQSGTGGLIVLAHENPDKSVGIVSGLQKALRARKIFSGTNNDWLSLVSA